MFSTPPTILQIALAGAFVILGFLVGFVLDRVIARRIGRMSALMRWAPNRIVLSALRGVVFVWIAVFGLRAALLVLLLEPRVASVLSDGLLAIFLLAASVALARIAAGFVGYYAVRVDGTIASTSIFAYLARVIVLALGVLVMLQSLGISITPALAALGVGGLAVALALQDTLANIFAGLHIIASKQVNPGEYVKLSANEEGYVTDINWRNTTIRSLQNNMVIVPNAKLASAIVTNYAQPDQEMAVLVDVGVSYDSDLDHVEQVTIDVARSVMRSVTGGLPEFEPFIRYHTFGAYSIDFSVIMRGREFVDQYLIKHEFVKRLHERYRHEGIRIPFPVSTVEMRGPVEWWREPAGAGVGNRFGR
jgi:small-conductance mechanosensitive channel